MNTEQQTATKAIALPQEERVQASEQAASESPVEQVVPDQHNEAPPLTGSRQWKSLYQSISSYAKEIRAQSKR